MVNQKGRLLSFRCDSDVERVLHARHQRAIGRMQRLRSRALTNGDLSIELTNVPSFSQYLRREMEVAVRRFDRDPLAGGNFRRALSLLLNPSDGDFARVVLSFAANANWVGFVNMDSYKRMMKLRAKLRKGQRSISV